MTLQVGSLGRRARLQGIARSIRRYLGTLDGEMDSVWHTAEMIDADQSTLSGESGAIARHIEQADDPWFKEVTKEPDYPEEMQLEDDREVSTLKLTEAGRDANQADTYEFGGQSGGGSRAVATDGGHATSPGDSKGGV
jgi:hypothetical protein